MNKFLEKISKGKMFIISFFTVLVFFATFFIYGNDFCYSKEFCAHIFELVFIFSMPSIPFLFFLILFSFIKKDMSLEPWKKFTFVYLLIYLGITIIFPWKVHDYYFSLGKDSVAFLLLILYFIISVYHLARAFFQKTKMHPIYQILLSIFAMFVTAIVIFALMNI